MSNKFLYGTQRHRGALTIPIIEFVETTDSRCLTEARMFWHSVSRVAVSVFDEAGPSFGLFLEVGARHRCSASAHARLVRMLGLCNYSLMKLRGRLIKGRGI